MSIDWRDYSGRDDPAQRYRIYRVADGGEPELVATCDSPAAVGVAIVTLGREGEFNDHACGVLDGMPECEACGGSGQVPATITLPTFGGEVTFGTCPECVGSGIKPTGTWTLKPWCASPREVSAAARVLRSAR